MVAAVLLYCTGFQIMPPVLCCDRQPSLSEMLMEWQGFRVEFKDRDCPV